jgi:O-antigen/teichoic acid export membrane protein
MSLKRQTIWSALPLVAVTIVNLVSVPLFYRYLGAEMYALWFYVATFICALGFMDFGICVAVGRYVCLALGSGDTVAA